MNSEKHFIYHHVPKNMQGTILYPLNQLKDIFPDSHEQHKKKYEGREVLLDVTLPILNCLWNDVIHFTAIDPHIVVQKMREAGFDILETLWFKVPLEVLDRSRLVVYTPSEKGVTGDDRDCEAFDLAHIDRYTTFPEATFEYYCSRKAAGKRALSFARTPHILYQGSVDTKDFERVTI